MLKVPLLINTHHSHTFLHHKPLPRGVRRSLFGIGQFSGSFRSHQIAAMGSQIDYISSSPLLANCGYTREDVVSNEAEWLKVAGLIQNQLGAETENLTDALRSRIFQYYLPVSMWILRELEKHRSSGSKTPLVVGLTAPQGCGKTTIVECLHGVFKGEDIRSASVSIDDFYLTRKDQVAMSEANAGNSLLSSRGNAGSFDVELGTKTLEGLIGLVGENDTMKVPRYDKSAHSGLGDRADPSTWPVAAGPLDLVLLEGWMLGFKSIDPQKAAQVSPELVPINESLKQLEAAWDSFVDTWIVVKVNDPENVFEWRLEAEHKMISGGKTGMTDEQIHTFCSRFMPAYKAYLPGLYIHGPTSVKPGKSLMIELDKTRSPIAEQPQPLGKSSKANSVAYELLFLALLVVLI